MRLDVTDYQTLTPRRPVDAANNTYTDLDPIAAVVFLDDPQPVLSDRGKRWTQDGLLRVRTDNGLAPDLRAGDEITLPEGVFGVIADTRIPHRRHALTGDDFGWARYRIRKGG